MQEKARATLQVSFWGLSLLLVTVQAGVNFSILLVADESFLVCMRDMVFAGSDTSNSVMEHAILHVSLRPEIQKRIQAEIDQVIGHYRGPSYDDRNK